MEDLLPGDEENIFEQDVRTGNDPIIASGKIAITSTFKHTNPVQTQQVGRGYNFAVQRVSGDDILDKIVQQAGSGTGDRYYEIASRIN